MGRRILELLMALLMLLALYIAVNHSISTDTTGITRVIVIDCGHGGMDGGKKGVNGVLEKEINLSIGYKLKSLLEDNGFTVVMTRTDDNGLYSESDSNKKSVDMKKRCQIISDSGCDLVISIHQNSYTSSSVKGAQMFYYKQSQQGKMLAQCLEEAIKETLGAEKARPSKYNDNYYMLLHTPCPTVIAECGFLSNYEEAEQLSNESYQQKVAEALCLGIMKFYGR